MIQVTADDALGNYCASVGLKPEIEVYIRPQGEASQRASGGL